MELPPNVYHRLMLVGGPIIVVDQPLPGGGPEDVKVWLIVYTPAKTDSTLLTGEDGESDGETRWTTPAKYHVLMREADGRLGEAVQVHEVWADKVLLATRMPSQKAAIEEFEALLREELGDEAKVDLQNMARPNGQQQAGAAP